MGAGLVLDYTVSLKTCRREILTCFHPCFPWIFLFPLPSHSPYNDMHCGPSFANHTIFGANAEVLSGIIIMSIIYSTSWAKEYFNNMVCEYHSSWCTSVLHHPRPHRLKLDYAPQQMHFPGSLLTQPALLVEGFLCQFKWQHKFLCQTPRPIASKIQSRAVR